MTASVGVSSAWKILSGISVGVSGVWKPVSVAYVGVSGAWKLAYTLFSGVTHTYSTPGSGTETVPSGATRVVITVDGPGGGGNGIVSVAGGGGAQAVKTIAISPPDWGSMLSYNAGTGGGGLSGGAGFAGDDSTVTGLSATLVGGSGGPNNIAGVASGGDTNTNGQRGDFGGAAANGGPGNGGSTSGGNGGNGQVKFVWS